MLWLPRSRALVVSDLHFEKGSSEARFGNLLPPFDTRETLKRLENVVEALNPDLLITLGDSFHDRYAGFRLHGDDKARLLDLSRRTHTVWIEGNHDPDVPLWLVGERCAHFHYDGLHFTHEPTGQQAGEVAGHLHPCARVTGSSGRSLRRRCFFTDARTLIMPAFGAFTGGLSVTDEAFDGLFHGTPVVLLAGGNVSKPTKVHAVAFDRVATDA
jgi:uncharacterized protein